MNSPNATTTSRPATGSAGESTARMSRTRLATVRSVGARMGGLRLDQFALLVLHQN